MTGNDASTLTSLFQRLAIGATVLTMIFLPGMNENFLREFQLRENIYENFTNAAR